MESNSFHILPPVIDHIHMDLDAATSHMLSDNLLQSGIPNHLCSRPAMPSDLPSPATPEEALSRLCMANNGDIPVSRIIPHVENTSMVGDVEDTRFSEHVMGNYLAATSLANPFSATTNLQDSVISFQSAWTSTLPSEEMKICVNNDSCSTLSSSIATSINSEFGPQTSSKDARIYGDSKCRWTYNNICGLQTPLAKRTSTVRPSYHVTGSSKHAWNSSKFTFTNDISHNYYAPSNELSTSISSSQLSATNLPNVQDQCSEVSCSGVTQNAGGLHDCSQSFGQCLPSLILEKGLQAENDLPNISLYSGSSSPLHFSHVLLGSRYLHATGEILADILRYALEDLDNMDESLGGIESEAKMSSSICSSAKELPLACLDEFSLSSGEIKSYGCMDSQLPLACSYESPLSYGEIKSYGCTDSLLQHRDTHMQKSELLSMLQMVDHGYSQYLEQIQNVISAFQFTTELGTQLNVPFSLRTLSSFYKDLRERISSQIFLTAQQPNNKQTKEAEKSFESLSIRKQWALQQLKTNDQQQSWKPQRGLPEKSVSVLRAWMFQNFLHPYPQDNEKQLLAIKSELTRSQVSNWFINARVRLWKPMIEEMYMEINKNNITKGPASGRRSSVRNGNRRMPLKWKI